MATLQEEISRRRTFAIISHPDAGKTTLTEKFLLYGGAIAQAGEVKGKRERAAKSDWMEIEKQRGISVTSSVMQFQHGGYCINILDTPGHQDFSEDTYRTLMAADSAVMVIDGAKGVEPQTRKLFKVCALRNIPIFTFINKMDRETRDPLELCEEVERELGIDTYPVNWPIGCGKEFAGVYDRDKRCILHFTDAGHAKKAGITEIELDDPALVDLIGQARRDTLADEVELLGAGRDFDLDAVRHGKLSPVFFGSALTNFGVEPFLNAFLEMTTPPLPRVSDAGEVDVYSPEFSAFVFKIQANMNKAHRDRLAFMRICSGKFERHHNDLFETRAIKKAFGEAAKDVVINSTKSMIGHLLGAAGGVEFITCVKSMEDGFIHQTVGTKEADEECDLNYAIGSPVEKEIKAAMSNSLGFGGHNATILIQKYEA